MNRTSGKVAVVTGGTKGIGLAVARRLVQGGVKVLISARDEGAIDFAVRTLDSEREGLVEGFPSDVRDVDACAAIVREAVDRFGRLDILVNNAGVGTFKPIGEMSAREWQAQIDTNLSAVFHLSKAAAPHLIDSGDGFIINVGSLASRHAFAGGTGYNASKFGLLGMTEAMMGDLRHEGVRVSIVMPGSVETGFGGRESQTGSSWRLDPDDVARAVVQLLEFPSSAHVSRVEVRPTRPAR